MSRPSWPNWQPIHAPKQCAALTRSASSRPQPPPPPVCPPPHSLPATWGGDPPNIGKVSDAAHFHLVALYESNLRTWASLPWTNSYHETGALPRYDIPAGLPRIRDGLRQDLPRLVCGVPHACWHAC